MNYQKPLVKNASDKEQIEGASKRVVFSREQELADLSAVLETAYGRRVMWRFLKKCKVYESIWDSSSRIHYNAGVQDIGHYLLAEVMEAGEEFYLKMMMEAKKGEL
jgi:hypothetical protein